jgi:glycerophosphoryl diester phosphodiesterase
MLNKFKMNDAQSLVFIQSFELTNLKKLKKMTPLPLVYLIDDPEKVPYDHVVAKDKRTYLDMLKPENLKEISLTAKGLGPYKRYLIPADSSNHALTPTKLMAQAHAVGLKVHPYTFRSEAKYLLADYNNDPLAEYYEFFKLGVDGLFTDFPDAAVKAWSEYQITLKKTKMPTKGKLK